MKRSVFKLNYQAFTIALVLTGWLLVDRVSAGESILPRVICAGGSEVFILEIGGSEKKANRKVWSWTASVKNGVPEEKLKLFRNLDECKPLDGGKRILICASNSGCGLIDFETGRLAWSTSVINAHSLEMLPEDRIIVASSLGGDQLLLFDQKGTSPEKPIWKTPLHSAHGLHWDEKRQTLWALGQDELRQYHLKDWKSPNPALELQATHHLPEEDGHDLRPVPDSEDLVITTKQSVILFDRKAGKFQSHPKMGKLEKVKAMDVHPISGRIVYTLWDSKIRFQNPDEVIPIVGNPAYKVRWFPGAP